MGKYLELKHINQSINQSQSVKNLKFNRHFVLQAEKHLACI